jgi:hypothetical protein
VEGKARVEMENKEERRQRRKLEFWRRKIQTAVSELILLSLSSTFSPDKIQFEKIQLSSRMNEMQR